MDSLISQIIQSQVCRLTAKYPHKLSFMVSALSERSVSSPTEAKLEESKGKRNAG